MDVTYQNINSVLSRVALLVAVAVAVALPVGYGAVAYRDLSEQLSFKAQVKAKAFDGLITSSPEVWMFAENRMQGLLTREPVPLAAEQVHVFGADNSLVTQAGQPMLPPVMRRSYSLYDATRQAGRIEVSHSLRPLMWGVALAGALGLVLGTLVYLALRTLPMRALHRVSAALFEQKQRAEVTLRSIGDAVITTDARGAVEFLNPAAERLSGWALQQAQGRPLEEVLRFVDAARAEPVPTSMPAALAENRNVTFGREIDLVRPDGSRIAVDDSAAPIHDAEGQLVGGVLVFRDVSVARNVARQRSWEAAHDSLTGLANRREFERLVGAAADSARDSTKRHVVCYMDLDQFKVVNDNCGHAAGDDLLRRASALMVSYIRASDTLARLGGDEFGLLLEGCTLERAELICADILAGVQDFRFVWQEKVFGIGVSIGMALIDGEGDPEEVMGRADTACYWAKEQGRNRTCVYRSGDSDLEARRRQVGWVARINAALAEDRFVLYGQSYRALSPAAGKGEHLEVLLRMVDEDGSVIQPGSFLPAAERFNLMPAVDRWVVRQVFAHYEALAQAKGTTDLTCAINLSATTINSEGFFEFVQQQAQRWELPAGAICFEITESSAINNLRHAVEFMRRCKALGFLFALDDFGCGMSSFGYLKDLPVDFLKIDGSFVRNLERDPIDHAMTEAINRIGHIMGIRTVAEYAENAAIIEELRRMGVDFAQGWGVCRATPLLPMAQGPAVPSAATPTRVAMAEAAAGR